MTTSLDAAAFALATTNAAAIAAVTIDPRNSGAMADGWQFTDGVIAAGALNKISFTNTAWAATAVTVGNPICVVGAGVGGLPLVTTIAAISGATIMLAAPASQPVSGAIGDFGTDDTAAVQAAINAAATTGAAVDFGGAGQVYYIAGVSAQYPVGFSRGSLLLPSNVTLRGNGATILLSGGRVKPGGMFWNQFWINPTVPTRNIHICGLTIDCNMAAQSWPALPAGFADTAVWQWGHAIALINAQGVEVRNCLIRNVRGDGCNLTSYTDTSGVYHVNRGMLVTQCEFYNVFGNGVACEAIGAWVTQNYFHGDGYWVAAVDVETNAAGGVGELQAVHVEDNVFDFRDGLSPVERTPAYATNSAQAAAARIHLRRAGAFGGWTPGLPGNSWSGTLQSIFFRNNTVWQGVMDAADFRDVDVSGNHFINTYEAITGSPHLIHPECILIETGQGNTVTGLERVVVEGNSLDSALGGRGIVIGDVGHARVANNVVRNCQGAGIRYAQSSGHIANNEIRDCGSATSGDASDLAGIAVYGGQTQPLDISGNQVIDTRTTPVLTAAVYTNVAASPVTNVMYNTAQGISGLLVDVNATTVAVGNLNGATSGWSTNQAVSLGSSLNVTGNATVGDTSGNHDGVLTLLRGNSGTLKIFFIDGHGIEYQMVQSAGGGIAWQNFVNGAYQWTDLAFSPSGTALLNLTWQKPLLAGATTYLWVCQTSPNAGQCRKKIGSAPTSDTDGSAGWN